MQRVALLFADGDDRGGAAGGDLPGPAGGVGAAAGRGKDRESAFAAGFDQDIPGGVAGQFRVPASLAGDAVQEVQAAAGGDFGVAVVICCHSSPSP